MVKDKIKTIEFTCQGDCDCCAYADEEECGGVMLYGPNQICAELKPIKRDRIITSILRYDYGDKGCKICDLWFYDSRFYEFKKLC